MMLRRVGAGVVAALLLGAAAPSAHASGAAAGGWELVQRSQQQSYSLYARPRAGSSYSEFRLEVVVPDATPDDVMAALEHNLLDPTTYPDGFERVVLRREGAVMISHDTIRLPLVSDRDAVMHTEIGRDPETGAPQMRWRALPEGPPPGEGVVRMPSSEGSWTVVARADGGSLAVYEAHVELGGSLPSALVESRMPQEIARQAVQLHRTMRERQLARR